MARVHHLNIYQGRRSLTLELVAEFSVLVCPHSYTSEAISLPSRNSQPSLSLFSDQYPAQDASFSGNSTVALDLHLRLLRREQGGPSSRPTSLVGHGSVQLQLGRKPRELHGGSAGAGVVLDRGCHHAEQCRSISLRLWHWQARCRALEHHHGRSIFESRANCDQCRWNQLRGNGR